MKINKQSNLYTIIYIVLMVAVVGTALALTSLGLKERQQANIDADKMAQILASAHITAPRDGVIAAFRDHITAQPVYNARGEEVEGLKAFGVDVAAEARKPEAERLLPLYVCRADDGSLKKIVPLAGAGLWGPIWGYVSFNDDATCTIYGAFFDHQGETPGLGAEITKPAFTDQFGGKSPYGADGRFLGIEVVKHGLKPAGDADYVDGVSGGTITSKGVGAMLDNCLAPYRDILKNTQTTEKQ